VASRPPVAGAGSSDRLPSHRSESPTAFLAGCSQQSPLSASPVTDNSSSILISEAIKYAARLHCSDAVQAALVVPAANRGCHLYLRAGCHFLSAPTPLPSRIRRESADIEARPSYRSVGYSGQTLIAPSAPSPSSHLQRIRDTGVSRQLRLGEGLCTHDWRRQGLHLGICYDLLNRWKRSARSTSYSAIPCRSSGHFEKPHRAVLPRCRSG